MEGKAQLFTRLLGDTELKGKVDASKNEVYQKFNNIDKSVIDRYMLWVSCQTINSDKSLSTPDKIKLWTEIYGELKSQKPHSSLPSDFREGPGFDLNSGQLAQATQLQDEYVYYICRQAGGLSKDAACVNTDWTEFTLAGMNDIEQRCDAYLSWLDAQRRSDRTPALGETAATGAATGGITGVTGAGTQAIATLATVFGTTNANWNSLLDVDTSTVQATVYTRQRQYRQANAGVIVPDRVAAIYLLRGYLRICMPLTIRTDITITPNSINTVHRAATPRDQRPQAPR